MPQRGNLIEVDMPDPVYNQYSDLDFSKFEDRLRTYENWRNKPISAELLTSAGFFYIGKSDIVRCYSCNIEGHQWQAGDDPLQDHKSWSPHCQFILNNEKSQLTGSEIDSILDNVRTSMKNFITEHRKRTEELNKLKKLNIIMNNNPKFPDKSHIEIRLSSFKTWPKNLTQKPEILAEAGFYYTGVEDKVLCFHCGGGLNNWEESDEPWTEHALWFPTCQFLNMVKGASYVKMIKETKTTETDSVVKQKNDIGSNENKKSQENKIEPDLQNSCKICYTRELGLTFLPCGHVIACTMCGSALSNCAICREPITAVVRAFLS